MSEGPAERSEAPEERIATEAALWQDRLAEGRLPRGDQARFDRWLAADPAHAESFRRMEAAHAAARAIAKTPDMLALRHETLARVSLRRQQRWRHAVAAAGVAAVLVAGGGWLAFGSDLPGLAPARPSAVAATLYETGPGQRTTVVLPDGSVAELDAKSRLRASFAPGTRQLQLEAGQALFEVAKDPKRPFVVRAGGETITAHGTRFNVRLADRRLEVALIEGRVAVAGAGGATEMVPHDLLRVESGARSIEQVKNIERFASWREGLVVLENSRLGDAVAEINRYAPRQIRLAEPKLAELRLSGAFRVDGTEVFVEALELYFGLHVVARTKDEIVLGAQG